MHQGGFSFKQLGLVRIEKAVACPSQAKKLTICFLASFLTVCCWPFPGEGPGPRPSPSGTLDLPSWTLGLYQWAQKLPTIFSGFQVFLPMCETFFPWSLAFLFWALDSFYLDISSQDTVPSYLHRYHFMFFIVIMLCFLNCYTLTVRKRIYHHSSISAC